MQIRAGAEVGIQHALQTLLQLLPPEVFSTTAHGALKWTVPCAEIRDTPQFPWRGAQLDVSRHFFPAPFIERYLDIMAMHKLNMFHWHLTDDQGWRIEIRRRPELTQIGAWRASRTEHWNDRAAQRSHELSDYGGFYTQEQVRGIVAYAQERGITIVPEIEMPGHSMAALATYPELSCSGGPFTVPTGQYWPITNLLCAGKETVFDFLDDVLTEVCALFPGPYVHIGGDEADKQVWESCPRCQQRIEDEGLRNEAELQGWFMERVATILKSQGKRAVGWEELLDEWELPDAVVMSWKGPEAGMEAAGAGHDVVMCPLSHCYFDHYQGSPEREPLAFGGYTPLEKVFEFEPVPSALEGAAAAHILGAQANLWTEFIPTTEHAEYMLLPRLAAFAEVVWSPGGKRDWAEFEQRLRVMRRRYQAVGLKCADVGERIPSLERVAAENLSNGGVA